MIQQCELCDQPATQWLDDGCCAASATISDMRPRCDAHGYPMTVVKKIDRLKAASDIPDEELVD